MLTFITICPYCHAGGVRAPATAAGASATCPKCRSNFTLFPPEDPPPRSPTPVAVTETRLTAAFPDTTEPSPVLTAEPRPAVTRPPAAPVATDWGLVLALAALILVGPAVLAAQLPFGRLIALTVAAVGFGCGALCLGAEGKARPVGGAAAALHALCAAAVLLLPSWLGLAPWRDQADALEQPPGPPVAVEIGTGTVAPLAPADWIDAETHTWRWRDASVRVRATVGPTELVGPSGKKRTTSDSHLHLTVKLIHTGNREPIPLSGWAVGDTSAARVTDPDGKPLAPVAFPAGWAAGRGPAADRLIPTGSQEVRFVFPAPPARTEFVRLRLAGSGVGAPEEMRFKIPNPRTKPGR